MPNAAGFPNIEYEVTDPMTIRVTRWTVLITLLCLLVPVACLAASESDDPHVLVFYRDGCHDCRHIDELLETLLVSYPNIIVRHIEETEPGAEGLMWSLSAEYGVFPTTFPIVFAGDHAIVGIGRAKELTLRRAVRDCSLKGCETPLARLEEPGIPWFVIGLAGLAVVVLWLLLVP